MRARSERTGGRTRRGRESEHSASEGPVEVEEAVGNSGRRHPGEGLAARMGRSRRAPTARPIRVDRGRRQPAPRECKPPGPSCVPAVTTLSAATRAQPSGPLVPRRRGVPEMNAADARPWGMRRRCVRHEPRFGGVAFEVAARLLVQEQQAEAEDQENDHHGAGDCGCRHAAPPFENETRPGGVAAERQGWP